MLYEAKHQPLLPPASFYKRVALHVSMAVGLLGFSLGMGMLGYVVTERMSWIDAFLNTAMLLGGMGRSIRRSRSAASSSPVCSLCTRAWFLSSARHSC